MLKRTPAKELIEALREVQRGGSPMTTHIARKVVQSFQKSAGAQQVANELSELSEREQQVLDLLAQGLIYKEIGEKLGISYETVHTYIRRIYEKLQVRTRTEAVAKFLRK
jgi:RNA polymerase sigma factor (sigma-70 family)